MIKNIFSHTEEISRDGEKHHVTQCFILINGKIASMGIAIQNPIDNYNKKLGNKIAFGRATKALKLKKNIGKIKFERILELSLPVKYKGEFVEDLLNTGSLGYEFYKLRMNSE